MTMTIIIKFTENYFKKLLLVSISQLVILFEYCHNFFLKFKS